MDFLLKELNSEIVSHLHRSNRYLVFHLNHSFRRLLKDRSKILSFVEPDWGETFLSDLVANRERFEAAHPYSYDGYITFLREVAGCGKDYLLILFFMQKIKNNEALWVWGATLSEILIRAFQSGNQKIIDMCYFD